MQVLLAEEFGFCFGVERAVEMVEGALAEGATVRTLGPLIHNTQEIERLQAEGVRTIESPTEGRWCDGGDPGARGDAAGATRSGVARREGH